MQDDQRSLWEVRLAHLLAAPVVRSAVLVLLVLLYGGWIGYQWMRDSLIDFNVYYISAYGFAHGMDVYGMGREHGTTNRPLWDNLAAAAGIKVYTAPYRYPPLTAQLVYPLTWLPGRVAGLIWLLLTALALLASARQLGKLAVTAQGPALAYLLLLGYVPPLTVMHAGQVNAFVLLAIVLGMVALARSRSVLAGIAFAVAAHLKLMPVALCFYLPWRKQWRATLAAAVALVGLLLTAPLLFTPDILARYAENFFAVTEGARVVSSPTNQSLAGFWGRTLPMLDVDTIYQIYLLAALVLLVATVAVCWPMRTLPPTWKLEVGLIVCAILLLPPYTLYHMLLLLLVPLVVVVEMLWSERRWALLLLVLVLVVATNLHGLFWHTFAGLPWLMSFPFWLILVLWGIQAWAIVRKRRELAHDVL